MSLKLPNKTFCIIRHGETTANRDHMIAGRLDVDLTDKGRQQALQLSEFTWPQPVALFVSPQRRALDTASVALPDMKFTVVAGLRERDWGVFEGRPIAELPPREGHPEAGEAWDAMLVRVAEAVTYCCDVAGDSLPVLVCHSGIVRAARILVGQSSVGERAPNAVPIFFEWTGDNHKESIHDAM